MADEVGAGHDTLLPARRLSNERERKDGEGYSATLHNFGRLSKRRARLSRPVLSQDTSQDTKPRRAWHADWDEGSRNVAKVKSVPNMRAFTGFAWMRKTA
jgi:hypothetical protein